mgnify:CR=1 FL=1
MTERIMSYLVYPVTIVLAVGLYIVWSGATDSLALSAVGAVVLGVISIAGFEYLKPKHLEWRPRKNDIQNDLLYTALIQVALPRLLGLLIALALAEQVGEHAPFAELWPREWPLAAQALLLIVSADFMRYWLHRLAHTTPFLWRLHAVHHSVDRLYWLNTSRFHPFEKILQFSLDSLPFILMGVEPRVLGFWFVVYSVNGFFQHSNIRLRFGFLSGVFSTAELHRWHHSKTTVESNANYANVFIIWDRLFGTYFHPEGREVTQLGLINRNYPMDFWTQLKTPLINGLDKKDASPPSFTEGVLNLLICSRMWVVKLIYRQNLIRAADSPLATQQTVLRRILLNNNATRYGREYGFSAISSYDEFAKKVPVVAYEALRPYVEDQLASGNTSLTIARPVMYARTSGTTGQPKYLPIVQEELARQRRHAALMAYSHYAFDPLAFSGKILALASPAVEGRFENGIPWGSASGVLYAGMGRRIAAKYVVPPEVFAIEDHSLKYLLILRLALAHKNITYLSSANPSTLLKLCALANEHWRELISDIEHGGFSRKSALPSHVVHALQKAFRQLPARAAELRDIFEHHPPASFAKLWPFLRLVSTWTSGNCAVAVDAVRTLLSPSTHIVELGYLSSEFRGTLTIDCETGAGLPTIEDYFFEFIEPEKWEAGSRDFRLVHQLENGRDYTIAVTTPSGLYRYFINDIVRVTGYFKKTPTIRFLNKGKGVTNLTGEKLYESQVIEAIQQAGKQFGLNIAFLVMLADIDQQGYRLYLEIDGEHAPTAEIALFVDDAIAKLNIEYDSKRKSGRLSPVTLEWLTKGAGEAYRSHCIQAGQKDGQYKMIALQYARECKFPFGSYLCRD